MARTHFLLKSDLNMNFGAFKYIFHRLMSIFIKFLALSNEKSFFAFIKIFFDIKIAPLNVR